MNLTEKQVRARVLLRSIWGTAGHTMTRAEWLEIDRLRIPTDRSMTAISVCLRAAGLWEEYAAANYPTWTACRQWIDRVCPKEAA